MADKELSRSLRLTGLQNFLSVKTASGGATLEEIMKFCDVTDRQIYRDLKDLEEILKVKVIRPKRGQKGGMAGRYRLDEGTSLRIGPEDAAAIFLSVLRQKGSPLAPKINEIKDIILAALYKNRFSGSRKDIESLQDRVHIVEEQLLNAEKSGAILLKLMEAIKDNRLVSIKYFKPNKGEWSKRDVEPYGLTSKHNNWYLVGYCRKSEGRRTFRIDLIDSVYVLGKKFDYPEDFCLQSYFGDSWGIFSSDESMRIVIKVEPELAYRFKLIAYHPSQKVEEELEDGSVVVSYKTCGIYEFTGWLLQWADFVEVLEPAEVRQMMREKLERMVGKYV